MHTLQNFWPSCFASFFQRQGPCLNSQEAVPRVVVDMKDYGVSRMGKRKKKKKKSYNRKNT